MSIATAMLVVSAVAAFPTLSHARQINIRTPNVGAPAPSPLIVLVSLAKQRVRVFDINGEIASSRISSGRAGFDTPTGVFSILEKNQHHRSNIYDAEMPFMQRITWSGIALHAGVVPGYRASHGCIRLPHSFAQSLFGTTGIGNRVVVTGEETSPIAFNHHKLFTPLPLDATTPVASKPAEPRVAEAEPAGEMIEANRLFGVTPALASAVALSPLTNQRRPTTRVEAERMLTDRLTRLSVTLKSAERARMAATEKAKVAVKAANEAKSKYEQLKKTVDGARANAQQAQRRQADAIAAYRSFLTADRVNAAGNADDAEFALEDAILDATRDFDTARTSAARGELEMAAAQAAFTSADSQREAAVSTVRAAIVDIRTAQKDLIEANKETVRRLKPISVFVSLRTQRVYVRQGFEPVLEAPIGINGLHTRFGTHVFTAMRYAPDNANRFEWHLVSAHTPSVDDIDKPEGKKKKWRREASPQSTASNIKMASMALDAIEIPPDVLATIAELARPGASLIVSDRDLPARENGLGTEFVVLTR